MKYSSIDPRVYGVKTVSSPQPSTRSEGGPSQARESGISNDQGLLPKATDLSTSRHEQSGPNLSVTQPNNKDAQNVVALDGQPLSSRVVNSKSSTRSPVESTPSTAETSKRGAPQQLQSSMSKRMRRWKIAQEDPAVKERMERGAAEDARRAALSPEEKRREDIENHARWFRKHLRPQIISDFSGQHRELSHYPIFLLQEAPNSRNGAACKLGLICTDRILPGDYRIAVTPGDDNWHKGPDFYHVKCFEVLLDLSSPHYVARFEPNKTQYIPDHGAQCILEEYIQRWKRRIEQNNNSTPSGSTMKTEPSGASPSATTEPDEWKDALSDMLDREREGDRPASASDQDWKITDYVVSESDPEYNERYALSRALARWKADVTVATEDRERLNERGRAKRDSLGDLKIEKIKSYYTVFH